MKIRPTQIKPATGFNKPLEDFEYLIHHMELNNAGKEETHHCLMLDHLGNMFEQVHLTVENGKVHIEGREIKEGNFHILVGLEPSQEVVWSNEEARQKGIDQKPMVPGMTARQKAAVW